MSHSSIGQPRASLGLVLFVGAFTLFNGVTAGIFLVRPLVGVIAARNWQETRCVMVSGDGTSGPGDGMARITDTYQVAYTYQFRGTDYHGTRYSVADGLLIGSQGMKPVVERLPPGTVTHCYVNPNVPTKAVLDRGFSIYLVLGFIPLLFFLAGVLWFVVLRRQKSKPNP